jgi:hypothetical protein
VCMALYVCWCVLVSERGSVAVWRVSVRGDDYFAPRGRGKAGEQENGYDTIHCKSAPSCRFTALLLLNWLLATIAPQEDG